jgi:hypothetical protein
MLMVYVPLLQNGCILNTQPIAANDYCRINGLFWNPTKTIHNIGFSIALDFQSMIPSIG